MFAAVRNNRPRRLVTHTDESDESFRKAKKCTVQCECSTYSRKMRYTT